MSKSVSPFPILFTIPNFITAGSGRVMFNILTRLDRNRYTPYICVSRKGGKIENELQELGIPVLELPFTVPALPYPSFITRAREAAEIVADFHNQLGPDGFIERQKACRRLWEEHFTPNGFYGDLHTKLNEFI